MGAEEKDPSFLKSLEQKISDGIDVLSTRESWRGFARKLTRTEQVTKGDMHFILYLYLLYVVATLFLGVTVFPLPDGWNWQMAIQYGALLYFGGVALHEFDDGLGWSWDWFRGKRK